MDIQGTTKNIGSIIHYVQKRKGEKRVNIIKLLKAFFGIEDKTWQRKVETEKFEYNAVPPAPDRQEEIEKALQSYFKYVRTE